MDVQASHFLWAAAPIVAHHGSPFQPAFSGDECLQMFANFCAVEAPRIRNLASFCVDLVPGAPQSVQQESLQYVEPGLAMFLVILLDVVGGLVELVTKQVEHDLFLAGSLAYGCSWDARRLSSEHHAACASLHCRLAGKEC